MMKKVLLQFLTIAGLFFSTWLVLSQIDWIKVLRIKQATEKTEEKLGDIFWELIKRSEDEVHTSSLVLPLDSLIDQICLKNGINRSKIKLHLIEKDEVNAFALPDNHMVVYTGLIEACENEGELAGILSHEIAHMEKNHVMHKLIKEAGLSVLISMTSGNRNTETIRRVLRHLSSTAYDRSLESEADITATEYLIKAGIDPEQFANFLSKLSEKESDLQNQLNWLNTHPASKERAESIRKYAENKGGDYKPVLNPGTWERLKEELEDN